MRLRYLFTAAAVAVVLAAPLAAQSSFQWRAGDDSSVRVRERVVVRLEHRLDRVTRQLSRTADRVADRVARAVARMTRRVERHHERAADRVRVRINARSLDGAHFGASMWAFSQERGSFDSDPCSDVGRRDRDDDFETHCEVRDETLPAGALNVDARPNGSIRVEAWDRSEIRVRAIVQARARTLDEARQLASRVQVQAGSGRVSASGPTDSERHRREWWTVSYRINVPRQTDLDLTSHNGGVSVSGVGGTLRFETHNGGVTLRDLAGSVRGETHNGSLHVSLGGSRWNGEGLDVETSNGGVTIAIPEGYNGQLETRTVNGGVRFDYPMTVVGDLTARRGITATLGSGGPTVRVRTTNGGLRVQRR
jgi:Putative adhesin